MKVISSISEKHKLLSLAEPLHPLISIVRIANVRAVEDQIWQRFSMDFYCIALKRNVKGKMQYGQQNYDYDKGVMTFISPKQLLSFDTPPTYQTDDDAGFALFFHPDFIKDHPLAAKLKSYRFFSYAVNEALHLSATEEKTIVDIFIKMEEEYQHMDRHTQAVMVTQIELLLNYGIRFYERQFITRQPASHAILIKLEHHIHNYFIEGKTLTDGIPTVKYLAAQLKLSPHYFGDLVRSLTGQSAQQHIQEKIIERAKELLSVTDLSVSEIAYQVGFKHPQSLNKLFKQKTSHSPLEFRRAFIR